MTDQVDSLVQEWIQILSRSIPSDGMTTLRSELDAVARGVVDILQAKTFDHDAAVQLGARLGNMDGVDEETSSRLADALVIQISRDLYPQELNILQPKLAVLIGGLTAGFSSPLNAQQTGQADVSSNSHYERELEALGVIAQKLKYIGSTLGESLDLEHVLQEIVESAHQTIPSVERAVFHLLDEKGNVLRPVAVSGVGRISKPSLAMRPREGIAGYVLASGQLLNVADIRLDPRYVPDETGQGLRSLLVVPVQRKELSLGTISAQSSIPNAFSAADEKLLTELAFRSTIAIENASLYKQEREQRLWAEVMAEASAALTHSLDLNTVLDTILDQVLHVVPAQSANIALIQGDEAVIVRHLGIAELPEGTAEIPQARLPLDLPAFKEMIFTGKPVVVPDVSQEPTWFILPGLEWIRAYAGAPLKDGDRVVGFINVDSEHQHYFDLETARRLQIFADHASLVMSNARLYEELKNALNQEQLMRDQMLHMEHLASMGRMVSLIAHALNNPLQSLVNSLYLTQQDVPENSPVREYLAIANSDVKRLSTLVSQLKQVYQPGRATQKQTIALQEILESVYSLVDSQFKQNNVTWHQAEVPGDLLVYGIPSQLVQVLLNIAINSLEAMQPQGGDFYVAWKTYPERRQVGISLRDTGRGIPPDDIDKLFDPYFTTKETGIGLGLTICYEIIEQHDGRIDIESTPGEGTLVTVWLPLPAG